MLSAAFVSVLRSTGFAHLILYKLYSSPLSNSEFALQPVI